MSQQCARDLLRGRSHQASGFCLIETVPWKRVRKSVCLLQRSPAVQERARAARYNIHSASAPDVLRPRRPSVIAQPFPPRPVKNRNALSSWGKEESYRPHLLERPNRLYVAPARSAASAVQQQTPKPAGAHNTGVAGFEILAEAERGTLLHPYLHESEESKAVREARRSRIPQKNHPESEAA